jgi:hypothetical protein
MNLHGSQRIGRRALLGGGIGAGMAALLLRHVEASADAGPPTRFLLIHKPCGFAHPESFFPLVGGTETNFQLGPITTPFEPFKQDMLILDNVTAPRDGGWQGDRHGAGLICMTTGSRAAVADGEATNADGTPKDTDGQFHALTSYAASVDQVLRKQSPKLKDRAALAAHLGAYRDSVQNGRLYPADGAPGFRVVSFEDAKKPVWPEIRPDVAVQNIFGGAVAGGASAIARQQRINRGVVDLIAADLSKLEQQVPASERPKLDAQLTAIRQLDAQIGQSGAQACVAPTADPLLTSPPSGASAALRLDAFDHQRVARTQLNTIKVAFQCDLIRTATFTYGHGNSDVQFDMMLPKLASQTKQPDARELHTMSHNTDANSADWLAGVDAYYSAQIAAFLQDLKDTKESDGSSMLDNTLVVYFSDVSTGFDHGWLRMPVIFFGGKAVGLRAGRWLDLHGRYMNDVWASTLAAFGVPLPSDSKFGGYDVWGPMGPRRGDGAVSGIFG